MGKFALGFAIGIAAGVAYVMLTTPKTGVETRSDIKASFRTILDTARDATAAREQELWAKFRTDLARSAASEPPLQLGY